MKQLFLLLKPSILTTFGLNKAKYTKDPVERSKAIRFAILIIVAGIILIFSLFGMFMAIGNFLKNTPFLALIPALAMVATSLTTLMFTIFKVNGTLFNYKDIELLMSLPVKSSTLIASRIINLYTYNILFCIVLMLPAHIVYGIYSPVGILYYVLSIIFMFIVPLLPIVVASIAGLFISLVTARFKKKNVIQIIFTFAFFILAMYFSFNTDNFILGIADYADSIMNIVYSLYPLSQWYVNGVCNFDVLSLLLFLAINIIVFVVFITIVGKNYKKINAYVSMVHTDSNYKVGDLKATSLKKALFKKEWKRFTSSAMYVFNTASGVVLMVVAAIALLIFGKDFLLNIMNLPAIGDYLGTIAPMGLCFLVGLTITTCASISLEGKSLWIIRSLPIPTKDILMSKLKVNLMLTIPAIALCSTIFSIALSNSILNTLMMYLLPLSYAFFSSLFGLYIDLKNATLDWENEVKVVKQSRSVFICTFTLIGLTLVPIILCMFFPVVSYIAFVVVTLLDIWLYRLICTKGVKLFEALNA